CFSVSTLSTSCMQTTSAFSSLIASPVIVLLSSPTSSKFCSSTIQPRLLASSGSMSALNFQRANRFSTLNVATRTFAMRASPGACGLRATSCGRCGLKLVPARRLDKNSEVLKRNQRLVGIRKLPRDEGGTRELDRAGVGGAPRRGAGVQRRGRGEGRVLARTG